VSLLSSASGLLQRVGLKRGQTPLSPDQAFEARPVRNPRLKWRVNDDECVEVVVPRRKDVFGRTMGFLFFVPESRPVILDEVGTRVWHLCDGERTVEQISRVLSDEYKLGRREVEASLTEYLRTLGKRGMVGFLVPKAFIEDQEAGELVGLADVGTTRDDLEAARRQAEAEEAEAAEAGEESDDAQAEADEPADQ
jgi:hypothetical protein